MFFFIYFILNVYIYISVCVCIYILNFYTLEIMCYAITNIYYLNVL